MMIQTTWRTIGQSVAVVAVSIVMMAGPSMAVVTDGDDVRMTTDTVHGIEDAVCPVHPADGCAEDESWTAVDYRSPDGIEDIHGVTRACRHNDDIR